MIDFTHPQPSGGTLILAQAEIKFIVTKSVQMGSNFRQPFGPVLAISGCNIHSAGAASAPVTIDDQVQATRVTFHLGVVQRRPAGAVKIYWLIQFDAQAF